MNIIHVPDRYRLSIHDATCHDALCRASTSCDSCSSSLPYSHVTFPLDTPSFGTFALPRGRWSAIILSYKYRWTTELNDTLQLATPAEVCSRTTHLRGSQLSDWQFAENLLNFSRKYFFPNALAYAKLRAIYQNQITYNSLMQLAWQRLIIKGRWW